jgi:4-methyl-5(b-hydroxyethyl)-thiazole monophosphate biosynthesis
MPNVLVPLAEGVEEMEAVISIDVLRRAGWTVVAAGLEEDTVTASRGVRLVPDQSLDAVSPAGFDVLVIPGGAGGVTRLSTDRRVLELVRSFARDGKWIAAVCAGPLVLQAAGILTDQRVTCHPAAAPTLVAGRRCDERVVVDGRLVTSQGAGSTFEFALTLVALMDGRDKARALAEGVVLGPHTLGV